MTMIEEMLKHNRAFVESKGYEKFQNSKFPAKKTAIVACMDTRLLELLPAALNLRNGDVKMIKNAGGIVPDQFDSTMRSLLVAVYELGVENIMIIGHTTCGVEGMKGEEMLHLMRERGVPEENIRLLTDNGVDLEQWLSGFDDVRQAVSESVKLVANHPLMAPGISVSGYVMDTVTGELMPVTEEN